MNLIVSPPDSAALGCAEANGSREFGIEVGRAWVHSAIDARSAFAQQRTKLTQAKNTPRSLVVTHQQVPKMQTIPAELIGEASASSSGTCINRKA